MAYRTVKCKGDPVVSEFATGGAITPGMLVTINSSNAAVVHPTASGNAQKLFAIESDVAGKSIDDAYASGEIAKVGAFWSGQEVIARLSNGESVVIGDALESNGDGYLQKYVADSTGIYYHLVIVGYACEAKDMSGSSGVDPSDLFRIRIA